MSAMPQPGKAVDAAAPQSDATRDTCHPSAPQGIDKAGLTDILDVAQRYLTKPGGLPARNGSLAILERVGRSQGAR